MEKLISKMVPTLEIQVEKARLATIERDEWHAMLEREIEAERLLKAERAGRKAISIIVGPGRPVSESPSHP
ncbi:hypothetical protein [Niabella hibiscisoli]|uniref:hypothetical protein n=1 Tax=Niabella hibiscisoli TaxID=1825928 RepID=UPI001F0CEEF5|nr:hypothetical protein [Niabella hibiscisoli]MCH5719194.1 hypothetical protein [Niabella hibiscisoli]